jgi:general secretion pathway protein A
MYETFYGISKTPFQITPDPQFLYLSPSHKEALGSIIYGIEQRKGFVVVLGEVGLGKTTVLRSYLDRRDRQWMTLVYVFNPNLSFHALLETILKALGIDDALQSAHGMVDRLHHRLVEEYQNGRNVVLVVDEAQNMPVETLEQLRVLSNLETATDKLLQIVLVGQPEFAATLGRHELRQLRQRIAVRCTLSPLSERDSEAYIEYRLNRVGATSASVFTRKALRQIVQHARGVPRTLNIVCDNVLVTGLGYRRKPVTGDVVQEVIRDLAGLEGRTTMPYRRWALTALALIVVLAGVLVVSAGMLNADAAVPPAPPAPMATWTQPAHILVPDVTVDPGASAASRPAPVSQKQ